MDGRDGDDALRSAAQRTNARRLGTLLALVVVTIVAAAFAFVISHQR